MRKINVLYWITTALLIPTLGFGSIMDVMANPDSVKVVTSLGYPNYLDPFLGLMRLLGLVAILLPKFKTLKEWAYAGLTFDIIGAIYSILAYGHPITHILFPTIVLLILLSSYILHHQRLAFKLKSKT